MKRVMDWLKKVSKKPLFLPLFSVFLVLVINVVYDAVQGNYIFEFFKFELKEGLPIFSLSFHHYSALNTSFRYHINTVAL